MPIHPPLPKAREELNQLLQASATEGASPEDAYAGISQLWFYCLLRATLIEQANTLPIEVFQLLLREAHKEAILLMSCINDPVQVTWAALTMVRHYLSLPAMRETVLSLLQDTTEVAEQIAAETVPELFCALGVTLAQMGEAQQARDFWMKVEQLTERKQSTAARRAHLLCVLARALFQADFVTEGQDMQKRAERAARQNSNSRSDTDRYEMLLALCEIAQELIDTGQQPAALILCHEIRLGLQTLNLQKSTSALVAAKLMALWRELQEDEQRENLVTLLEEMIEHNRQTWRDRGELFRHLAAALSLAGHTKRAEEVLHLYALWPPIPEDVTYRTENGFLDEEGDFLAEPDEKDKQAWIQEQLLQQALRQHDWERAKSLIIEGRIAQQRTAWIELLKTMVSAGMWKRALRIWQTARNMPREEGYDLACTLIELSKPLLASGHRDQAWPLLRKALECAEHISWRDHRVTLLQTLGEIFAHQAAWEEVECVLILFQALKDRDMPEDKDIPPPWQYHAALVLLAYGEALARAGEPMRAESIFEQAISYTSLIDESYQDYLGALHTIAEGLMRAGQEPKARLLATSRLDQRSLARLLLERGRYLFTAGQHEQARAIWSEIEQIAAQLTGEWKSFTLLELIETLLDYNEQEEARRLLPPAEATAPGLLEDQHRAWGKAGFLLRLVHGWARLHEFAQTSRLVRELRTLCAKGRVREPEHILGQLAILARQYHLADEDILWQSLQVTIKHALRVNRGPYPFYGRLLDLAEEMIQAGEQEEASALLAQLQEGVEWNFPRSRDRDLCRVGSLVARLGRWEWAEAIARSIITEEDKMELLINLAYAMAERGHNEQIVGLIQRTWPLFEERATCLRMLRMTSGLVQKNPFLAETCYHAILEIH